MRQLGGGDKAVDRVLLADVEDSLFSLIEEQVDVLLLAVGAGHDPGPGANELADHRLVADQPGVMFDVGRRGDRAPAAPRPGEVPHLGRSHVLRPGGPGDGLPLGDGPLPRQSF